MSLHGRWTRAVSAILATGLLLAAAGCAKDEESGSAGAASTLKIGFLGSLSGTYQAVGTDLKKGFELYLKMHDNKLGGHPIDLKVADEGDGADTAVPAATKLIKEEKVLALTGIVGGGSVAGVAPLLNEAKVPLIGSNGRPDLKDVSRVWTTSFMSTDPGQSIAQYIKDKIDGPVFAIGPNYQGGWDEVGGFTTEFAKIGGKLANPDGKTLWTPFPTTTNFLPFFSQVKAANAKAVYTFYAGKAAIDFVKQYKQSDAKDIPLYGAFLTEGSVLQAEGDSATGVYTVCNYSPDLDNEENRKFVAAWQQSYPDATPTTYAMASYDAAAVLDRAIAAAGDNVTSETINEQVGKLGQISSPRGQWQFGKNHAPIQKWYLRQVKNDGRAIANVLVQDLATVGA
ncbi:ABC transporter substrate-binding protein [Dactylosporangium sp. AC04546]|uniref:ABC transporter substrate-binding protein n=1 Tax=Dactylosporangium sp. AC04546 TaxID=2862460 RepID=UPI001EE117F2|nr:ABC transporter substrate-binding protein [Dactylosporangium sp. AC04546]WVK85724.1 ABC transporter substrate-binding protein [Dactylosporangium sp. AC04546]